MTQREIEAAILQSLRKLGCDADTVLPVHHLQFDLGVDSTEMVELAALVKTECGLALERLDLTDVHTVADLARRVDLVLRGRQPCL